MAKLEVGEVLRVIAASGADVVIIGGVANILHGGANLTRDVDYAFTRRRETVRRIVDALAPFHPMPVDWPDGVPFVWDEQTVRNMTTLTLDTDIGRVDFLAGRPGHHHTTC